MSRWALIEANLPETSIWDDGVVLFQPHTADMHLVQPVCLQVLELLHGAALTRAELLSRTRGDISEDAPEEAGQRLDTVLETLRQLGFIKRVNT